MDHKILCHRRKKLLTLRQRLIYYPAALLFETSTDLSLQGRHKPTKMTALQGQTVVRGKPRAGILTLNSVKTVYFPRIDIATRRPTTSILEGRSVFPQRIRIQGDDDRSLGQIKILPQRLPKG